MRHMYCTLDNTISIPRVDVDAGALCAVASELEPGVDFKNSQPLPDGAKRVGIYRRYLQVSKIWSNKIKTNTSK